MKFNWPRAHWAVGTLALTLFPLAGLYMQYVANVPHLSDAPRLMFRSRFLFLQQLTQRLASILILAAPLPLIVSFFVDPGRGMSSSPWTVFTMRGLFLAAVLLAWSHRPRRVI